mmetsp:Transcript_3917/g.9507  ORF Transcript_3917/g.9507 Transcript_3917/m.9507 type:complete len:303 (-) Transcript_3917:627-1535(-)
MHVLRLVQRYHFVFLPLEEDDGAGELLDKVDGAPLLVDSLVLGVPSHERVEVPALELVRVLGEGLEVADAIEARARLESVLEGKARQCGVAARASPLNCEHLWVYEPLICQVPGRLAAVLHIPHTPRALEPISVRAPVPSRPSVVHVGYRIPPRGPVLDPEIELRRRAGGGSTVALDEEGRQRSRRRVRLRVLGRVEVHPRVARRGVELNRPRLAEVERLDLERGRELHNVGRGLLGRELIQRHRDQLHRRVKAATHDRNALVTHRHAAEVRVRGEHGRERAGERVEHVERTAQLSRDADAA